MQMKRDKENNMRFDIYCDESRPDLFSTKASTATYLTIGSLWLPTDKRDEFKDDIHALKEEFHVGEEFKWQKVSTRNYQFYETLLEWFMSKEEHLRYRCIAVKKADVNFKYHRDDHELGFYKFYYQMLHHWILDFNEYAIFCDYKRNHINNRLETLAQCLTNANLAATIKSVQAVRSEESVLIQMADFLTGLCSSKLNNTLSEHSNKRKLLDEFEIKYLKKTIAHTSREENKFNVFVINLCGGW